MASKEGMGGELLRDLSDKINIDGLKELCTAPGRVTRLIWALLLSGSALVATFYSYRVISEYIENGTATKVRSGPLLQLLLHTK
jgi:hypothetical protein